MCSRGESEPQGVQQFAQLRIITSRTGDICQREPPYQLVRAQRPLVVLRPQSLQFTLGIAGPDPARCVANPLEKLNETRSLFPSTPMKMTRLRSTPPRRRIAPQPILGSPPSTPARYFG